MEYDLTGQWLYDKATRRRLGKVRGHHWFVDPVDSCLVVAFLVEECMADSTGELKVYRHDQVVTR